MARLIKNSKLTNRQLRQIISYFALELTSAQTSKQLKLNRNTTDRIYQVMRERLARYQEASQTFFKGKIELDESYFGGKRKFLKGRTIKQKIPVFGILKRNGKVYTQIVPDVAGTTLRAIIRKKIRKGSTIYTDGWRSYDGLIVDGYRHYRINHDQIFVRNKRNHINGIESFWSYAKNKLVKHYGVTANRFYFYLKEMEFRFNNRNCPDLAKFIEKIIKHY